jgi:hypothetical protein
MKANLLIHHQEQVSAARADFAKIWPAMEQRRRDEGMSTKDIAMFQLRAWRIFRDRKVRPLTHNPKV